MLVRLFNNLILSISAAFWKLLCVQHEVHYGNYNVVFLYY